MTVRMGFPPDKIYKNFEQCKRTHLYAGVTGLSTG
jgi:hypothetical protein